MLQRFFGAFASERGETDAEKKRRKQLTGGLDTGSMPNNIQQKPDPFIVNPDDIGKKKDEPLQYNI